ncbi:MAG: flagellar basal-body MS-ring/collar protein FliF [Treponemataceae bacterium]
MNEWFKKIFGQIKEIWSKWKLAQKIILIAIVLVVIAALVLVIVLSSKSTEVVLFNANLSEDKTDQIMVRLEQDNIRVTKNQNGRLVVKDKATASRAKGILFREGLVDDFDPWTLFDTERWSTTDFERDVNKQRAVTAQLKKFIESYDDVDKADVILSMPEKTVFLELQQPVSVSVILTLKPGSDFYLNKKAVKGMQKLIIKSIAGLKEENVAISDTAGNLLNDFEGMADIERVDITKREQKLIMDMEKDYRRKILESLQKIYGSDRVRDLDVRIEMDMSEIEENKTEYSAITKKDDNPDTPYDDSVIIDSLPISEENINKRWTGTGYNPEGPAGVEGQNPPVYSDMSNLYGTSEESSVKRNHALNSKQTYTKVHAKPGRRTVSVAIDGVTRFSFDEKGNYKIDTKTGGRERIFSPLPDEDIVKIEKLIKDAIGYDRSRGDSVTVIGACFDRKAQELQEDAAWRRAQQTKRTIFYVLVGVVTVLAAFLIIRFVTKEMERRRRLREEEILRQNQLAREKVLWNAEQAGMEVTMSVEERKRAELQENAISAAKDHPEDVAQLIRTWLMEE